MTANPVLVEVTRGGEVESVHHGAYCIADAAGRVVEQAGDAERPIFPRSAIKAFQALPLVESGAAAAFGFTDAAIALACASHNGEPDHVETARTMLQRSGLDDSDLECGAHWPYYAPAGAALARAGARPGALHNNCSGKHAGMLAFARHSGFETAGYVERRHPVQQAVAAVLDDLCGITTATQPCGIDGCSIPTWAIPLRALAHGFARFATGAGLSRDRAEAARRVAEAVFSHPFMVAGTGRFCTELMEALPGRAFVKTGAEGVFCGFIPQSGLGFAVKCDDGATRAAEVITAALLHRHGALPDGEPEVEALREPAILNRRGRKVGSIRAAGPLADA